MSIVKKWFKSTFRPLRDFLFSCYGFGYDLYRYARYSGYKGFNHDPQKRDYRAVKLYHRLEKSLAFRNRNQCSGIGAAEELITLLKYPEKDGSYGFQECVSFKVLEEFRSNFSGYLDIPIGPEPCKDVPPDKCGGVPVTATELRKGALGDPEQFFFSRVSVRDFSSKKLSPEVVRRALKLAMKTPSVCNRQGWYVYHTDNRQTIDECLSYQNGNRGFGHEIPSLMILAADLKAFNTAGERYQQWLDGGMLAMSLVYSLHALGVASCCLNWSKTPGDDVKFRKKFPIKSHHSILMMLAVGYPKEELKVCGSPRRPIDSIYEYWG